MGAYICQFGKTHKTCRCPQTHNISCDVPQEHGPADDPHGEWIFQQKFVHVCIKPAHTKGVASGDKWRCNDCKTVWRVKKIGFDQRDNDSWIEWEKDVDQSGIYASGTR